MKLSLAFLIVGTAHGLLLLALYACGRDSAAPALAPTATPTNQPTAGPSEHPTPEQTKKPKKEKGDD
jgi:glucose/arabinose dehydrogenase